MWIWFVINAVTRTVTNEVVSQFAWPTTFHYNYRKNVITNVTFLSKIKSNKTLSTSICAQLWIEKIWASFFTNLNTSKYISCDLQIHHLVVKFYKTQTSLTLRSHIISTNVVASFLNWIEMLDFLFYCLKNMDRHVRMQMPLFFISQPAVGFVFFDGHWSTFGFEQIYFWCCVDDRRAI